MNIITDINGINKTSWLQLIEHSTVATWFQTPVAYEFFASLPNILTPFVIALENNNQIRGLIVGYITQERNAIKQFFTRRAIIIGGPLLDNDITNDELDLLLDTLNKQLSRQAIYIETRNFNDYSSWKLIFEKNNFSYKPHLNFHVDTSSMDIVNSHLGKNRKRDIRVSFRDGANIITKPTLGQIKEYYNILSNLYSTKVKTPLFSFDFFEKLFSLPSAHFLLVEYQNKIIGGTVCVELPQRTIFEWFVCGEDGKYKNIFPSEVATFAGLQYAAEHECNRFDMMGAGTPDEAYGVRDFKARFGGELVEHGRFINIRQKNLYKIGTIGVKLLKIRGGVKTNLNSDYYLIIEIFTIETSLSAKIMVSFCVYTYLKRYDKHNQ